MGAKIFSKRDRFSQFAGLNPGKRLIDWYKKEGRDLPWRENSSPYQVWISEVILQQTRVNQGIAYYERFLARFPTVTDLANAPIEAVLKVWEGLGYYSRARNLHKAAQEVVFVRKGKFPTIYSDWETLKGIGPYTARAIGSIVNGDKVGVIDGNVLRVLSRYLGDFSPIDKVQTRQKFQFILDDWIQKHEPAVFNQAFMELGALVCKPKNPNCADCPLSGSCKALAKGLISVLPVKTPKKAKKTRYFFFFLISDQHKKIGIRQRDKEKGIWAGLWEIPNEELNQKDFMKGQKKEGYKGELSHIFTHFEMKIKVFALPKSLFPEPMQKLKFIRQGEIHIFAFSRAVLKIFEQYLFA